MLVRFPVDRQGPGSHEIWRHSRTGRKVTIAHHPGDMAEGTLRAILREAGIETVPVEEFNDTAVNDTLSQMRWPGRHRRAATS
jgi:predicted RNA binding protein YcfA (HicA-like mRNA interferase family)